MKLGKNILIWVLAFILMVASAVYQRATGPTYPMKGSKFVNSKEIKYKLPRSHDGQGEELVKIEVPDQTVTGKLTYKRFKSHDEWTTADLKRSDNQLLGDIPEQPPAGKVIYHIDLVEQSGKTVRLNGEGAVIRFKGKVPPWVLYPHIFFMFFAMVLSTKTGLHAAFGGQHLLQYAIVTTLLFMMGGMLLGPIVQKYAFDAYWTGWPFGTDLTDNKTLVAFIFWAIAVWRLKKDPTNKWWPIIAAVVLIAVYLIPHSMLGSEIDYTKMPQ